VKFWATPACVADSGVITKRAAHPGVTVIVSDAVSEASAVSTAVSVCVPIVIGVTWKVPTPLTRTTFTAGVAPPWVTARSSLPSPLKSPAMITPAPEAAA